MFTPENSKAVFTRRTLLSGETVRIVSGACFGFARTGNPNHLRMPKWEPYDVTKRLTMVFDADCKVVSDPTKTDRLILEAVGL